MSTKRSRATKPKATLCKPPHESQPMFQGILSEEKARKHRKAQAAYRARPVAAGWDPPKRPQAISQAQEDIAACTEDPRPGPAASDTFSFQDHRARDGLSFPGSELEDSERPAAGTTGSPTPDERIACTALAELAQGPMQFDADKSPTACQKSPTFAGSVHSKDSVLERAMQLTSTDFRGALPPPILLEDGPVVLASRTGAQAALHWQRRTADTGTISANPHSQTNAGTLTRPTLAERMAWHVEPIISWDYLSSEASYISYSQGCAMNAWRLEVCKAVRRAYLAGEELLADERTLCI
ncbi:hypothetical protein B0H13DRAFT_1907972 [Mycena leptocephala]|nr:hypothetical protein B0H13DRAFT_1907972 [Mycena leptocephala]